MENEHKKIVICAYRPWNTSMYEDKLSNIYPNCMLISKKKDLDIDKLRLINPDIVFFLDWSWIIKKDILEEFECIGFHSAPLPKYRGGSPIQNQIINGEAETKLTAFLMDAGVDTGKILLQKPLSLRGHILDIMGNISELIFGMIIDIVSGRYTIKEQEGEGSYYSRRKPSESEIFINDFENDIEYLYNFIRMLEDPYPNAFMKLFNKKITFKSADKNGNKLLVQMEVEVTSEENK